MDARPGGLDAARPGDAALGGGPEGQGREPLTSVLLLHSSADLYGADLQLLAIARGLEPTPWQPLCVLPERGELGPLLEQAGAEVAVHPLAVLRRAGATPAGAAGLARAMAGDRRELGALARARGARIVHSNTSVVLSGQAVARAAGAAHLMHVREIYAGAAARAGRILWPAMRRRLLRADAVACISDAVAAQFEGSPRALVLRDGLPRIPSPPPREQARAELGVAPGRFVAALVGRVSDWKGQDVLARALAEPVLAEIGALALLVGDAVPGTGHEAELDGLARELGVSDRLLRLGFRRDVDTVLGAADAVVVPSTRPEPLGLVALEGAAAGLPVVASAHGGVTEVVEHCRTGTLVAPGDHAALARALRALAEDPAAARAQGAAGRELVARRFGLARMLEELGALYGRLAERG